MPNTGLLQVVQLDDVADTALFFLAPGTPTRLALDLAGPEQLPFTEVVRKYRRWLGWSEPRIICLPAWVAGALYRLGDVAGRLGWRPPLRSTARREVVRGAVGDPREWSRLTGITPQSLSAALASEPASVQERWFAALYLLKPVLFSVLFAFWILSGLLSIGSGNQISVALMSEGWAGSLRPFAVIAGSLVDLAIGIGIAIRRDWDSGSTGKLLLNDETWPQFYSRCTTEAKANAAAAEATAAPPLDIRHICSEKYQAAKAAGTLNGTWPQFYSRCTAETKANPPAITATPAAPVVTPPVVAAPAPPAEEVPAAPVAEAPAEKCGELIHKKT